MIQNLNPTNAEIEIYRAWVEKNSKYIHGLDFWPWLQAAYIDGRRDARAKLYLLIDEDGICISPVSVDDDKWESNHMKIVEKSGLQFYAPAQVNILTNILSAAGVEIIREY